MTTAELPTMSSRGDDYVGRWPDGISTRVGISVEYVAQAMNAAGLIADEQISDLARRLRSEAVKPLRDPDNKATPLPEIASLTGPQAKAVITEMHAIKDNINARRSTHCHFCGLPLASDGQCKECV